MIIKCTSCKKDFDFDTFDDEMAFCPFCGNKIMNYGFCENCGNPYTNPNNICEVCTKSHTNNIATNTIIETPKAEAVPSQPVKPKSSKLPDFIIPFPEDNAISGEPVSPSEKSTPVFTPTPQVEYAKPATPKYTDSFSMNRAAEDASIFSAVNNASKPTYNVNQGYYNQMNSRPSMNYPQNDYINQSNSFYNYNNNRSNFNMNQYHDDDDDDYDNDNFSFAPEKRSKSEMKKIQKLQQQWANDTGNYSNNMNSYSARPSRDNSFDGFASPTKKKTDPLYIAIIAIIIVLILIIATICILYFGFGISL